MFSKSFNPQTFQSKITRCSFFDESFILTVLEAQQNATRLRLTELTKSEEFFKERMGLKFKKLDSKWGPSLFDEGV